MLKKKARRTRDRWTSKKIEREWSKEEKNLHRARCQQNNRAKVFASLRLDKLYSSV
jgi:hypothetical protein